MSPVRTGRVDEGGRRQHDAARPGPPQQRLDRGDLAGAGADDGLVEHLQLAALHGAGEVPLQLQGAGDRHPADRQVPDAHQPAAALLGGVHGGVRLAEDVARLAPAGRAAVGDDDAHAARDDELGGADRHGPPQRGAHPVRHAAHAGREDVGLLVRQPLAHHDELVPGEAGERVPRAHHRPQPLGHLDEDRVAGRVAVGVVDALERVDVEEEDGDGGPGPLGDGEGVVEPVEQQGPVGQAGEVVVDGAVGELLVHEPDLVAVVGHDDVGDGHVGQDLRRADRLVVPAAGGPAVQVERPPPAPPAPQRHGQHRPDVEPGRELLVDRPAALLLDVVEHLALPVDQAVDARARSGAAPAAARAGGRPRTWRGRTGCRRRC